MTNSANGCHDKRERQPRLNEAHESNVLPEEEHPAGQLHHIPGGRSTVAHQCQRHPAMTVAIVPEQIVHPLRVLVGSFIDCFIPSLATTFDLVLTQLKISRWVAKAHVVRANEVRTYKGRS